MLRGKGVYEKREAYTAHALSGPHIPCSPQQSTEPVHSSLWPSCGTQLQRLQEGEEEEEEEGGGDSKNP